MATLARLLLASWLAVLACGQCHKKCSGHGTCDLLGRCNCFDSYMGADCSLRVCPKANAWVDYASSDQTAHQPVECANRGHCDRETGLCHCEPGYHGGACQREFCPNSCSNHGRCVSINEASTDYDGYSLNHSFTTYSTTSASGEPGQWDAEMIHGCVCDIGFTGFDCSQRECDAGDDLRTSGQKNEVAYLYCRCPTNGGCGAIEALSSFRLSFMGQKTKELSYNATNTTIAASLRELDAIRGSVHRTYDKTKEHATLIVSYEGGEGTLCTAAGTTAKISFFRESGDLPPVVVLPGSISRHEDRINLYALTYQTLVCTCGSSTTDSCTGTFTVGLDGHYTSEFVATGTGAATTADLQTALANLPPFGARSNAPGGEDAVVTVTNALDTGTNSGDGTLCVAGTTTNTMIELRMHAGNQPALLVTSSLRSINVNAAAATYSSRGNATVHVETNDGTTEREFCNAGGGCDFVTGQCECDEFRMGDSDLGDCGGYAIEASGWTGIERCAGYVDFYSGDLVEDYNGAFIFYTDDGGNQTAQHVNTTAAMLGLGDDDLIYPGNDAIRKAYAPSNRQVKDRGIHVLSLETMESTCIVNLTNGSSAVALDLSTKNIYATSLDGNGAILRFQLPPNNEALLYADPLLLKPALRLNVASVNTTFVNTSSKPYGMALDLRFNARAVYWTQPGITEPGATDGKLMKAYLDQLDANGHATRVIDLTPTINAGLKNLVYGGSSKLEVKGGVMSPRGLALDLRKPHMRMYWLDVGVNKTYFNNSLIPTLRDGRLFRSNLDGTDPVVVLPYGHLKSPTSLVLDLVNNTAFVGDEAGRIWAIDMDFTTNENQNVSQIYNAPKVVFEGIMSYGALCATCTNGVRMKKPSAMALDYREREAYKDAPPFVKYVTTVYMYWTDEEAGVLARGAYTVDTSTGLGTWGDATVIKHLIESYGNTAPRGLALDLGFGIPRGGSNLYECYGHGHCGGYEDKFKCNCFDGWFGNCNMSTCPKGLAWFDEPWGDQKAHRPAECSNMGRCDRAVGKCRCQPGYYGAACQFQECVQGNAVDGSSDRDCGGRGKCLSMRDLALLQRANGDPTPFEYGATTDTAEENSIGMFNDTADKVWDADMVHGCACDTSGFVYRDLETRRRLNNGNDGTAGTTNKMQNGTEYFGYDCSLRRCTPGDDPKTIDSNHSLFEVQNVTCGITNGTFALMFRGRTTTLLRANTTTLADLQEALEELDTIGKVRVEGRWSGGYPDVDDDDDDYYSSSSSSSDSTGVPSNTLLCDTTAKDWGKGKPSLVASVTFLSELGDVPLLRLASADYPLGIEGNKNDVVEISEAQRGTKENLACSDRGICDETTGNCQCFITASDGAKGFGTASDAYLKAGFMTSDGEGNIGLRGDCGHLNSQCDSSVALGARNLEVQDWRGHKNPAFTNNRAGG